MKSTQFPIQIAGQTYHVDRTFDNSPAAYEVVGKDHDGPLLRHVSETTGKGWNWRSFGAGAQIGDVVIFVSKAPVIPAVDHAHDHERMADEGCPNHD